jgi:alkanesulfonate monooxygenase SsuD/methylene tetrahydromethanopterin reductase-like flavin-dependent oxidoreductase (luciferase family)
VKTAIGAGGPASGQPREFAKLAAFAVEAEKLGVDSAWSAEAWGYDAVSILAYLAAKTDRLVLGSGILQISARAPSMTAMTALALAALSGNRFILGLGVGPSGGGLHGVRSRGRARMRRRSNRGFAFRGELPRYRRAPRPAAASGEGRRWLGSRQPEHRSARHALARASSTRAARRGNRHRSRLRRPRRTWRVQLRRARRSVRPHARLGAFA